MIVVLSHQGFPQDCKLAATVAGVDVILSGHTHNRLTDPVIVNDTIIMQSGAHGAFIGRLDLTITRDGVADWTHALLPIDDSLEPDTEMTALVDAALAPFATARGNVIGETSCTSTATRCSNRPWTTCCSTRRRRSQGIELLLKLENPAGHRIQQLTIGGEFLADDETVKVAFLGEQAVPADTGSDRRSTGILAVEALVRCVRRQKIVAPAPRGDVRIV